MRAIVGTDRVVTAEERLAVYADPYSPGVADEYAPSGAILPASVDEIRGVLGVATRYLLPLWTVSLGRNYAYGGAAPCLDGSVILDLKRMRKIEVNRDLAYALVEPGVTYLDLYKFIQEQKHGLWIDCPDRVGAACSATRSNTASATPHTATTPVANAAWRWSSPMARSCARALAP